MNREAVSTSPMRAISMTGSRTLVRLNWPVLAVLALFAVAALIVPTLAPVATTDDWGYTRSVEILLDEGRLTVLPAVAVTAVFQILWGAFFGLIFGVELGVMRLSTVVAVAIGGLALYGLCRQLGVDRGRAALGVAAYLFNPLAFILAFTFMTDPHFVSWLLVATFFYARGMGADRFDRWNTLAGSGFAAAAFLVRQQGALIPFAVVAFIVLTRAVRIDRAGFRTLVRTTAIPFATVVGYYLWLRLVHGVPGVQETFSAEVREAGLGGTWRLARSLTVIELMYLGFFALPIVAAVIPAARRAIRGLSRLGWLLFGVWSAVLAGGVTWLTLDGRRMPYLPQFVGAGGLGPPDVLGSRPRIFHQPFFDVATAVSLLATIGLGLLLCRAVSRSATAERTRAGLILAILLGQVAGILAPSYHYLNRNLSLDRYLLPLLPLTLCLILWAIKDLPLIKPVAWGVIAVFAVFSTAATRDYLVYMNAVWELAAEARDADVAETRLEAGAAWDGYHLYTDGLEQGITASQSPQRLAWWLTFYGKPTDAAYAVSSKLLPGYEVIWVRHYSPWLQQEATALYLLKRTDVTGPPCLQRTGGVESPRSESRLQWGIPSWHIMSTTITIETC